MVKFHVTTPFMVINPTTLLLLLFISIYDIIKIKMNR